MDGAEQDQYEARLKELFDSFDLTGSGSLGQEELTDLCHVLHLEEVAPGALQQTLLQDNLLDRVNFDQFKEALILILSRTITNEESFQEPDSSPEAQPKYIKGGKRYGRRSLPEFQQPAEEFEEVTVIEPLNEEARLAGLSKDPCDEHWQSQDSEEYEAEGQLRFWNPDDLNTSPNISHTQDWIEEKLREVCESLGISRDGHLNREKLVSICEQYGLQNIDTQVLEEVFCSLEHDGMMSIEDFFYGLFKIRKPLPPSASTPYRQLKRHLSMQSFDESGRRTTTTSAMTTTISFRVFSSLDDGMGYATVDRILDVWHEEGIENSHEILKALDFSLDGKINLAELTLALENELLITKNGIYQATLASFKTEIRHLMERVDQVVREKEKLRMDLEKAEKLKSLMASEVDDHHAAIEHRNEYNLRKLDEEYKDRVAVLRNELRKEREQILQQAAKQRVELEQEIEALKTEENYLRDRLALTLKENSRLESELLETGENLAKYESMASRLQKNLENVLAEKFGDLDPSSAEFFLQEERLMQMRIEYERQCRELQDQIDELQSELEAHRAQGKGVQLSLKNSLYEELGNDGVECTHELGSEDCNPLNMSIEAEMLVEQMKDRHHRDVCDLQQELESTVRHYEKQLEETKSHAAKEREILQHKFCQEVQSREQQVTSLQAQVTELQAEVGRLRHRMEQRNMPMGLEEETSRPEPLRFQQEGELQARQEGTCENVNRGWEELMQADVRMAEKLRSLAQMAREEKAELEHGFQEQLRVLAEKHALEMERFQQELAQKHQQELWQERIKMEKDFNGRLSRAEEQFAIDRQALASKYGEALKTLEERYQQELRELSELRGEEKSRWELEKDGIIQGGAEAKERWKETLEREKAVSSALAQEKELLEKHFKERLDLLMLEKEQLEKQLQDAKKREEELCGRLSEAQARHEKELRDKEEEMSAVGGSQKLLGQELERLEVEFSREREELNSRLATLECSKEEMLSRAAAEERELRMEVSKLEGQVEELQNELLHLSKQQSNVVLRSQDSAGGDCQEPGVTQESGDVQDNLLNLQMFQNPEGDGNTAGVLPRTKLPYEPEEPLRSPHFSPRPPETLVEPRLPSAKDEDHDEVTEDDMEEVDASGCPVTENQVAIFGETVETFPNLKKAYEEMRAENETLRLQTSRLQDRICLLEEECERAAHDQQDMAFQVQRELDEILQAIPKPKTLPCSDGESEEGFQWGEMDVAQTHLGCTVGNQIFFAKDLDTDLTIEELSDYSLKIWRDDSESIDEGRLRMERNGSNRVQPRVLALPEELQMENGVLKAEWMSLFEQNHRLQGYLPQLIGLQCRLEESSRDSLKWEEENQQLREKVKGLEEAQEQMAAENQELQSAKLHLHSRLEKLEEVIVSLKSPRGRPGHYVDGSPEGEVEKRGLQEVNRKLKERLALLLKQKSTHAQEKEDLNTALHILQSTCGKQQQHLERLRDEAESLREENAVLRNEIALLKEEGNLSSLQLRELNGSREELWQKIETVRKEKVAVQKMAENLKKKVSELKARNQQLEVENATLGPKNPPNQPDAQDRNQQLLRVRRQTSREPGKCGQEEWERESSRLQEEQENFKIQSSTLVSSLEVELSQVRAQVCALEQENRFLKQELEKMQQAAKGTLWENRVASLKQEKASWERRTQSLKTQIAASQDKISQLKSNLKMTQQENETVKQEVMSLHEQLQTANEKNRALEWAVHSMGLQSPQKTLSWDKLDQLVKQEQHLLQQENETLQREVPNAKSEPAHSREKVRQPESILLSLAHQKPQSPSGIAKTVEQEKEVKRECERLQKELLSANRKVSRMNSLEHELETINLENEALRKQELLPWSSSMRLSQTHYPHELQQEGCVAGPREQYQQLRHQLFQAERRSQRLQEELDNRALDTNMPQGGHELLLKTMEKRMMDVEQQLRLVKRLLQDKVNQLKEQFVKNTKADEMVKDLYVENAQLLKALEMTEQRQKTAEKKNYLLEEKISNLSRIVKNLTSPALGSAAQLGS